MPTILPKDSWSIMVRGPWNVRVFTPEWVATNLLPRPQLEIVAPIAPGASGLRYIADGVIIYPSDEALLIQAQRPTELALGTAERVARTALSLLEHTPVSAFGINFNQLETEPSNEVLALRELPDADALVRFGCLAGQTGIGRKFVVEDLTLNVRHDFGELGVQVSLNFHFDCRSAREAAGLLDGKTAICRALAARFLDSVYNTTLRTEDVYEPI